MRLVAFHQAIFCTLLLRAAATTLYERGFGAGIRASQAGYAINQYKTEPTFVHTYFLFDNDAVPIEKGDVAPGYLFLAPAHGAPIVGLGGQQFGPQIRHPDGTLIWYGPDYEDWSGETRLRDHVQNFFVCDYLGSHGSHLCWSEKAENDDRKHVVLDSTYSLVKELYNGVENVAPNPHEFNPVDNGMSYVHGVWITRRTDLRPYGGTENGPVADACIQEISMVSEESMFEWCWMANFPVWQTNLWPEYGPNITGNLTVPSIRTRLGIPGSAWDAWHLNSVDKSAEGDYVFSVRHADQLVMLAGNRNAYGLNPGTMMWRMGGPGATIKIDGEPFNFSKQHDVRFLGTTRDEVNLTILDNAWEGLLMPSDSSSSGMIISVNNARKTAKLLARYRSPTGRVCPSQGNMNMLPNGNVLMSWGSCAEVSEFTVDGKLLYHMSYTNHTEPGPHNSFTYSYRITKEPWVGTPLWSPKVVAYSQTCAPGVDDNGPLNVAVSWNGATEVARWRFAVAAKEEGPWEAVGTWPKDGFETEVNLTDSSSRWRHRLAFPRFVAAEAIDANDELLENGHAIVPVFVPFDDVACGATACSNGFDYTNFGLSRGDECTSKPKKEASRRTQFVALAVVVLVVEYLDVLWLMFSGWPWGDKVGYVYDTLPLSTTGAS